MDVLLLCYRDQPLREFPLRGQPLEVGRGAGCDIVVHDPGARERHCLVVRDKGTVFVHDLEARREPIPLPPGGSLRIGDHHALVRLADQPVRPRPSTGPTEPLGMELPSCAALSLVVGRGSDARRVALDGRPLSIGTGRAVDLRLHDRAVSSRHCRLEPGPDGLRVRDLGSRNGTFVDGVPVTLARVDAGSTIRIGRTDLRLVARGRRGDARDGGLVAESDAMQEVLEAVERVAPLDDFSVLVTGETGSGKEGIARALHDRGRHPNGPFVAINAGGLPPSLVESELFGHEKGAFTGAVSERRGVFEQADGGTLFLDEIGELPMELQARLLRVLETWEVRRVGGERTRKVKVRLVCATHRDLPKRIEAGEFRQDLYYRIAQLALHVPPLRARPRDVEALAEHFLRQTFEQLGPRRFAKGAIERLIAHDWPGNARELRNVVRAAAARRAGRWITPEDLDAELAMRGTVRVTEDVAQLERVLAQHDGNMTAAARTLGIARSTLRDRLRRQQDRPDGPAKVEPGAAERARRGKKKVGS